MSLIKPVYNISYINGELQKLLETKKRTEHAQESSSKNLFKFHLAIISHNLIK